MRCFNKINEIWRADGIMTSEDSEIKQEAVDFYKRLLNIDQRNSPKAREAVLQSIPNLITDQHNEALQKQVIEEEVRVAIFLMEPNKAPGPDGFPTRFYQKN